MYYRTKLYSITALATEQSATTVIMMMLSPLVNFVLYPMTLMVRVNNNGLLPWTMVRTYLKLLRRSSLDRFWSNTRKCFNQTKTTYRRHVHFNFITLILFIQADVGVFVLALMMILFRLQQQSNNKLKNTIDVVVKIIKQELDWSWGMNNTWKDVSCLDTMATSVKTIDMSPPMVVSTLGWTFHDIVNRTTRTIQTKKNDVDATAVTKDHYRQHKLGLCRRNATDFVNLQTHKRAAIRLKSIYSLICCFLFPVLSFGQDDYMNNTRFLVGTGIYDVTGPAGQVNMMGYAKPEQTTAGIHQRLYARAFIFAKEAADGTFSQDGALSSHDIIPIYPKREQQHHHDHHSFSSQSSSSSSSVWERWMMFWNRPQMSGLRIKHTEDPIHYVNTTETVCFVSIDTGMGSDLLNIRVLERLKTLLPEGEQSLCTMETLSISGTHTHR